MLLISIKRLYEYKKAVLMIKMKSAPNFGAASKFLIQ